MTRWDRFTHTRVGRTVVHPLFITSMVIFMVVNAGIAGWALTTAWSAKSHEITVARNEAGKAVAKAQEAQEAQARAKVQSDAKAARDLETARQAFCHLIDINASDDPPPSTARGFAQQEAYKQLGRTPFLHCFPKS